MNGYNYPDNLLALFSFLLEEELVIKKSRSSSFDNIGHTTLQGLE